MIKYEVALVYQKIKCPVVTHKTQHSFHLSDNSILELEITELADFDKDQPVRGRNVGQGLEKPKAFICRLLFYKAKYTRELQ